MAKKLKYKDVKYFIEIESNSGCKLISEEYLGTKKSLKIQCSCGEVYETSFSIFKQRKKYKCSKCTGYTKWNYNLVKEYVNNTSDCKLLSKEYKNSNTLLEFECKCGNKFETTWDCFINNNKRQCNICGFKLRNINNILKYEDVKYFIEVESDSDCKLLSKEYIDYNSKLLLICKCGNEFKTTYGHFKHMNQRQCKKCGYNNTSKAKSMSHEEFVKKIYDLYKNEYSILSQYSGSHNYILVQHNICNTIFTIKPYELIQNNRCLHCYNKRRGDSRRKTIEQFIQEIYDLVGDEYIVLGEYKNSRTNILMKHNTCGYEWEVMPSNFLNGTRCPNCNNYKMENKVKEIFVKYDIPYIYQYKIDKCRDKKVLPFDFAIHIDDLILLETDGIQHFHPVNFGGISDKCAMENFKTVQYHDAIKNKYCEDNNIKLLRIPYWDFDNIEEILKKELTTIMTTVRLN